MKNGIELIAEERQEQLQKHNHTTQDDLQYNGGELVAVARLLCDNDLIVRTAPNWGFEIKKKLRKDRIHQLKVAGALIAAEIDRLNAVSE